MQVEANWWDKYVQLASSGAALLILTAGGRFIKAWWDGRVGRAQRDAQTAETARAQIDRLTSEHIARLTEDRERAERETTRYRGLWKEEERLRIAAVLDAMAGWGKSRYAYDIARERGHDIAGCNTTMGAARRQIEAALLDLPDLPELAKARGRLEAMLAHWPEDVVVEALQPLHDLPERSPEEFKHP